MSFSNLLNDEAVLKEMGQRIGQHRVDRGMTQAGLAQKAGIAKRTVERFESGHPTQTETFIRILRILGLLDNLDALLPEPGPRPMDLLKLKGRERRRASSPRDNTKKKRPWSWGDES